MRELILTHSYSRPPFAIQVFTTTEAKASLDHLTDTYFRHFKLYKYVFTPRIAMDLSFSYPNEPVKDESIEMSSTKSEEIVDAEDEQQISEAEIEEMIRKTVSGNFKELMKNFEKQISDTTKQVKEKLGVLEKPKK